MLKQRIEQVVRLVRSKGIGVYFVTQNPLDVPDTVLGQLSNRAQHALRAFTPRDQKDVRAAAQTFRPNPKVNVEKVITELEVGEALVSFLDEKGTPGVVERALITPPHGQIGPITPDQRKQIIAQSVVYGTYEKTVDRESAYERLKGRSAPEPTPASTPTPAPLPTPTQSGPGVGAEIGGWLSGLGMGTGRSGRGDTLVQAMAKSAARSIGSSVGRQIVRGVLGSLLGSTSRR
jgi:DNA helicase HerA-like ATPase